MNKINRTTHNNSMIKHYNEELTEFYNTLCGINFTSDIIDYKCNLEKNNPYMLFNANSYDILNFFEKYIDINHMLNESTLDDNDSDYENEEIYDTFS